jgi:hypothetical protein
LAKLNMLTILAIIVTFGTAIFVTQMLIPLVQFNIEQQDDRKFDERFFGYGTSQTVSVNFTQSDIEDEIERGRQALASCEPAYFDLIYNRDRINIAIDGGMRDGMCAMAIRQWVSGTFTGLDCAVPQEKLVNWDEWTRSPNVSQLREHCKEISSSYVGEIVPAEA